MPVVFRKHGYVASFYSNEGNEPIHVHVRKGGGEAKFWIGPVRLHESVGFKVRELARAEEFVREHETLIREKWNEYFA